MLGREEGEREGGKEVGRFKEGWEGRDLRCNKLSFVLHKGFTQRIYVHVEKKNQGIGLWTRKNIYLILKMFYIGL